MRSVDEFLERFRAERGILVSPRIGGFDAAFSRRMRTFATWMTSGAQVGLHVRERGSCSGEPSITRPDDPIWVFVGAEPSDLEERLRVSKALALSPYGGKGTGLYPPIERALRAVEMAWMPIHAGGPALRFPGREREVLSDWCRWVAVQSAANPDEAVEVERLLQGLDEASLLTSADHRRSRVPSTVYARRARSEESSQASPALKAARGAHRCRTTGSTMGARKVASEVLMAWVEQEATRRDATAARALVLRADQQWMLAELRVHLDQVGAIADPAEVLWRGRNADEQPVLWIARLNGTSYGLLELEHGTWTVGDRADVMAELSPDDFAEASVWVSF